MEKIIWPFQVGGDAEHVFIRFKDPGQSGIDPATLRLSLNQTPISTRNIHFDEIKQVAKIKLSDLRSVPLRVEDGFYLEVQAFSDRGGNMAPKAYASEWNFDLIKNELFYSIFGIFLLSSHS